MNFIRRLFGRKRGVQFVKIEEGLSDDTKGLLAAALKDLGINVHFVRTYGGTGLAMTKHSIAPDEVAGFSNKLKEVELANLELKHHA